MFTLSEHLDLIQFVPFASEISVFTLFRYWLILSLKLEA
jgi:hypothetical protein